MRDSCIFFVNLLVSVASLSLSSYSERLRPILAQRRGGVTVVLENVRKENVALVARTAEALGIASLHLIYTEDKAAHLRGFGLISERTRAAQLSRISRSATDWLSIRVFSSASECLAGLSRDGYELVATSLGQDTVSLYDEEEDDWALGSKIAIFFGSEGDGLSGEVLSEVSRSGGALVTVPQRGLTQSLNVATCSAIVLSEIARRRDRAGKETLLTPRELADLEAELLPVDGRPVRFHNKASVKHEARRNKKEFKAARRDNL